MMGFRLYIGDVFGSKAKSTNGFARMLGFVWVVNEEKSKVSFPRLTDEEILTHFGVANAEIEARKFISQARLMKKLKGW